MRLVQRETVILAENYDALVDWYVQVLGFRETKRFENGYRYCNLESEGGVHIGIAPAKEMGVVPGDRKNATVLMQIEVEDLRALFTMLPERGGAVTFGPALDETDQFWYGGIADLEGNPIWVVDSKCP